MQNANTQITDWSTYRDSELTNARAILDALGFTLEAVQPHISGERFLMSGRKLVLLGKRAKDGKSVVIKLSSDENGKSEIRHERQRRVLLEELRFSYHTLPSPREILSHEQNGLLIFITEFIPQQQTFIRRPLHEQYLFALRGFLDQESIQATTYGHAQEIKGIFEQHDTNWYQATLANFIHEIERFGLDESDVQQLKKSESIFQSGASAVSLYGGFLTHADFVPHNLRIIDDTLILLDQSSLHFGNKHESWARFMNFMLLYNRPLMQALTDFLSENRSSEELASLRLMRIYKLVYLIKYYVASVEKTSGDLRILTEERVRFWMKVLNGVMEEKEIDSNTVDSYVSVREKLRSEEEKERQKNLH